MIINPASVALVGGSLLGAAMVAGAAVQGWEILRAWDLSSGSSRQLELERRTYLVSTLVGKAMVFQVVSLFLLVFTADALAPQFTGAMCAAGSLKADEHGYPALLLGLVTAVLAGLWLILDRADEQGHDYPLIRVKYAALLFIAPLVLVQAWLLVAYFEGLRPEIITSCCGSLFSAAGRGAGADLAALQPRLAGALLYGVVGGTATAAAAFVWRGRGAAMLAVLAGAALPVALAGIIAFVSPYVYELPTHHCPFCLLQREYHWLGYPLYATLFGGCVGGMGVGVLSPFRRIPSLALVIPAQQRLLAGAAALLLGAFLAMVTWSVASSSLRL